MSEQQCGTGLEVDERELGEKCQYCGKRYLTIYRVPVSVWEKISPKLPPGGLLCPECAEFFARQLGIVLYWEASLGGFLVDIEQNKRRTAERRAWQERKRREKAECREAKRNA